MEGAPNEHTRTQPFLLDARRTGLGVGSNAVKGRHPRANGRAPQSDSDSSQPFGLDRWCRIEPLARAQHARHPRRIDACVRAKPLVIATGAESYVL